MHGSYGQYLILIRGKSDTARRHLAALNFGTPKKIRCDMC